MKKSVTTEGKSVPARILLLLALMGILSGCAGLEREVPAENRIIFTERTSGDGVFSSGPLMVKFNYQLQGQALQLTGAVDFRGGYDSLNVYVLLIDASGAVLQRNIVYYSGYRVGFWPGDNTFQANLDVPAGSAGFSFSYSAQPVTIRR